MRVKMSKPPPPAPTASAIGPCPTIIKIVGHPGTGSLPSTIAPPDHPLSQMSDLQQALMLLFHTIYGWLLALSLDSNVRVSAGSPYNLKTWHT